MAAHGQPKQTPRGSILPLKRREEWVELLSDISGVAVGAVSELLWWYTFDMKVAEATAPIQPLFEVRPGYLAMPLSLIATNSVERNLQKILSRHPSLRSLYPQVKSAKEQIALTHLCKLFPAGQFLVKPTVIIKDITDADLVVYQPSSQFALVIQHKWLIAPETVAESSANDDELRKGATQAVQSRDFFRTNQASLRQALGLPADQLIDRVEAMVICRGAEPTGFLERLSVPIALELAFEELWEQASYSLPSLWEKLSVRPDHIEAASRYKDTAADIQIGDLWFSVPAFSLEVKL